MKQLHMITYTYRSTDEQAGRDLVKRFLELGENPGVLAHYERLDGKGGVLFQALETGEALAKSFERTMVYGEFLDFEITEVTPFEDALPTILKLYG
jgi:hypothetical protein